MEFKLKNGFIELDNLLKVLNFVACGSEAKALILNGKVMVNDVIEMRVRRKLHHGDSVQIGDVEVAVV